LVKNPEIREKALHLVGFDKFLQELSKYTPNKQTAEKILSVRYSTDPDQVKERINLTSEFLDLLKREGYIPLSEIPDITGQINLLSIEESVLKPEDLLAVGKVLNTSRQLKNFLTDKVENTTGLARLYRELYSSREMERLIGDSIDESGMVKDQASRDLARIRKNIKEVEKQITAVLERIIHSQKYGDVVQDRIITVRRDRYVIPVKQNFAGKIQGIIQDRSSSGQTVYLEPVSVVHLNNRLSDLKLQEQIEVRKILKFITDRLREKLAGIKKAYNTLIEFDYLYAVGRYGVQHKAVFPQIGDQVELIGAKHPVFLMLGRKFKPIDLKLTGGRKGLVITGPNTGGKTVALKTLGLFAALVQSGIPVPVAEGSQIPVFDGIYADIGDMQSIEQNLSTFSAHVKNIKDILSLITEDSLVLLDELIPGTDPDEGSALGIGILEKIKKIGAYAVATTHFKQIKVYALSDDYFNVASVGFDRETLSPTYTIHYNSVGQSMAFYIAEKLGLDREVIEVGRKYLDKEYLELGRAIDSLEKYKTAYEEELEKVNRLKKELEEEKSRYLSLKEELEREREKGWETVRKETAQYLENVREEGYRILDRIRSTGRGSELEAFLTKQKKEISQKKEIKEEIGFTPEIGDTVKLKGKNAVGEVISVRENKVHINVGGIKIWTDLSSIEPVKKGKAEKKVRFSFSRSRGDSFKPELKIIGKTKEEALRELSAFLDRALTEGFSTVRIIHGYGSGVLRKAVREYLDNLPYRVEYGDAPYSEGGMGVTVVHLK